MGSRPSGGGGGFRDAGFSGGARSNLSGGLSGSTFNRNTAATRPSAGAGDINRAGNRGDLNGGNINRANIGSGNRNQINGGDRNFNAANIDRNVNVDVDNGWGWGYGSGWGAAAAGAIVGSAITAAAIGTRVYTLPAACSAVIVNGITYQQCGSTWYEPSFVGSSVSYTVVTAP